MARRRARVRARAQRNGADRGRTGSVIGALNPTVVPRVLLGAVNGVEVVAVGVLQLARDVLVSAVSGAANVGTEAVTATVAGARGVVSAASQMVGDVAGTARDTLLATIETARRSRRGLARAASRRAAAAMTEKPGAGAPAAPSRRASRSRPRTRGLRLASRPARPSEAA